MDGKSGAASVADVYPTGSCLSMLSDFNHGFYGSSPREKSPKIFAIKPGALPPAVCS